MDILKYDQIDKSFDKFTPYPILSTLTGMGRIIYGVSELINGIASNIIYGVGKIFCSNEKVSRKFDLSILHIFFGASNVVKGFFEAFPLVNLLVLLYNTEGAPLERKQWDQFIPAKKLP